MEVSSYGTVRPRNIIIVSSLVEGNVSYALPGLREGIIVKKGEIILKIDDINYRNLYLQCSAKIEQIKASIEEKNIDIETSKELIKTYLNMYKLDKINYKRFSKLVDTHSVSEVALEKTKEAKEKGKAGLLNSEAKYKIAKANISFLKAQRKSAEIAADIQKLNAERCIIRSPINGRIINAPNIKGEYVTKGSKLFTIVNDKHLEIPVSLSMSDAANIFSFHSDTENYEHWFSFAKDVPIKIYWSNSINKIRMNGRLIGVKKFNKDTRTVTFLVSPVTGTDKAKTYIPLVSGMFCRVQFEGKTIPNSIRVPLNAIQLNRNIYTIGKDKLLKYHKANVISYGNSTAIVSVKNLKDASFLIVQKLPQGITDGAKIKIIKPLQNSDDE